jgi:hypothetical protein
MFIRTAVKISDLTKFVDFVLRCQLIVSSTGPWACFNGGRFHCWIHSRQENWCDLFHVKCVAVTPLVISTAHILIQNMSLTLVFLVCYQIWLFWGIPQFLNGWLQHDALLKWPEPDILFFISLSLQVTDGTDMCFLFKPFHHIFWAVWCLKMFCLASGMHKSADCMYKMS